LLALLVPGTAVAHPVAGGTGGVAAAPDTKLARAICEGTSAWRCEQGARLTLQGESLADVREVRFVGGRGPRDDRVARPQRATAHRVEVEVPGTARSGPIAVVSRKGPRVLSARRLEVKAAARPQIAGPDTSVAPAPNAGEGVFPVAGEHDYGTQINRFGGGRGHKGNDVFAKCGSPLVALFDAKVQFAGTQSRAGNYLVLQTADGQSYPYMHMQSASMVRKGEIVRAGQQVGRVGDSGRATGCHLHFEQWTAPGWYEGGEAIDPAPLLKRLDG